jgi:hypothetical protein
MHTRTPSLVVALALLAASPALAQHAQGDRPDANLLAGPRLADQPSPHPTLVELGLDGRLVEPEGRIEFAAAAMLPLSPDELDHVQILRRSRASDLDRGGPMRVKLILDLQGALALDDAAQIASALAAFDEGRPTWADRRPLADQIRVGLSPSNALAFDAALAEYTSAWLRQEQSMQGMGSATPDTLLARRETTARVAEVYSSYERTSKERQERFNAILARLNVTPQQDAAIRNALVASVTESNFKPRPRDGLKALGTIWSTLTWSQRTEFFRFLKEERQARGEKGIVASRPQTTALIASTPFLLLIHRRKRRRRGHSATSLSSPRLG